MAENNGYNELLHELNLQPKPDASPPTSPGGEGKTLADYVQTKDSSGIRVLPDSAHESPDAPTQVTVKTDDETPATDDTAQLSEEPAADSGALEDTNSTNESDIEGEDELTSDDSRDMSALSQGEEDEEDEDEYEDEYEGIPDDADDRGYGDEGSFFSRTSTKIGLGAIAFSFLVIGFIALGGINGGADDSYRNSDIAAPDRNLSADEITSGDYEDGDDYYDDDRDALYDDDDDYYDDDDESSDDEVDDSDRNVDYVDTDDSSNGYYPGPTDPQGTHLDNTTQQAGGSQQPQQQPQQQRPTGQKPAVKPAPAPKPSQKPNGSVQERPGAGSNETPPAVETVYQTPDRE